MADNSYKEAIASLKAIAKQMAVMNTNLNSGLNAIDASICMTNELLRDLKADVNYGTDRLTEVMETLTDEVSD